MSTGAREILMIRITHAPVTYSRRWNLPLYKSREKEESTGILRNSINMVARFATLFALLVVVCYVHAEPEPEPTPEPEPVYGRYPWHVRPYSYHKPSCGISTTTTGALVVPTLATIHSRGRARSGHAGALPRGGQGCF